MMRADLGSLGAGVEVPPVLGEGGGLHNSPKMSPSCSQNLRIWDLPRQTDGIRVKTVRLDIGLDYPGGCW